MAQEAALVLLSCQALPSRRTDLLTRRVQPMRTPSTMLGRCGFLVTVTGRQQCSY